MKIILYSQESQKKINKTKIWSNETEDILINKNNVFDYKNQNKDINKINRK